MTDPIHESGKVSITGGMARGMSRAMVTYGAARQCPGCEFGIPRYPGRYPTSCPRCGESMTSQITTEGQAVMDEKTAKKAQKVIRPEMKKQYKKNPNPTDAEHNQMLAIAYGKARKKYGKKAAPIKKHESMPVVCASRSNRIQEVIESGTPSFQTYLNDPQCSRQVTVPYSKLPEGFKRFVEMTDGPLFFRMESKDDPVLIFEFDDTREKMRMFATSQPDKDLAFDPREDIVVEDSEGTFEPPLEETVRMVDMGSVALGEAISPEQAGKLQLFMTEDAAQGTASQLSLALTPEKRLIGEEHLWVLVHEGTGYALGKGEAARLMEVMGSGPGGTPYAATTYGPERVRARHRAIDRTHDRTAGAFVEDKRASLYRQRKMGQRQVIRGGMRIKTEKGKDRKPNKDVGKAIQNKKNASGPRASINRIRGLKKFHRSTDGQKMHRDLAQNMKLGASMEDVDVRHKIMDVKDRILRYNAGQQRKMGLPHLGEDIGVTRPRSAGGTEQMTARGPQNLTDPTADDHFEALLRRLIVTQDMDVLQDVEFDENTGSIYLFFDPVLMFDEIEEILEALRQERGDIMLIASPDGDLPGESVESDWWVMFLPGAGEGLEPDPLIYGRDPQDHYTKVQAVVMAQPGTPEALAQGVDVASMIKSAGS